MSIEFGFILNADGSVFQVSFGVVGGDPKKKVLAFLN